MNKEWKGNKNSVRVMNGDSHNPDRAEADYYTTDPDAVREFLNVAFPKWGMYKCPYTVWEPACGSGNISEVLREHFMYVYSTDLFDRGYEHQCCQRDFLSSDLIDPRCRLIITNPPYSLSDQFILHALDILPEDGSYIALLNINYLAGINRWNTIYKKGYLQSVYVYTHRIHCYKNNEVTGHSSPVNYAWFCFSKSPDYQHIKCNKLGWNQTAPFIHWLHK